MFPTVCADKRLHGFYCAVIQIQDQVRHVLDQIKHGNAIFSAVIQERMVDDQQKQKLPDILHRCGKTCPETFPLFPDVKPGKLKPQYMPLSENPRKIKDDCNRLSEYCCKCSPECPHIQNQHKYNIHGHVTEICNGKSKTCQFLVIIVSQVIIQNVGYKQNRHTGKNRADILPADLVEHPCIFFYSKKCHNLCKKKISKGCQKCTDCQSCQQNLIKVLHCLLFFSFSHIL